MRCNPAPASGAPNLARQWPCHVAHRNWQSHLMVLEEVPSPKQNSTKTVLWGELWDSAVGFGGVKCFKAQSPGGHSAFCLTQPKPSGELKCGRTWLPFFLTIEFIAFVLPSMHQSLIQIQTHVKVGCDLERTLCFRVLPKGC